MKSKIWGIFKVVILTTIILRGSEILASLFFVVTDMPIAKIGAYMQIVCIPILLVILYCNCEDMKDFKQSYKLKKISLNLGFKSILAGFSLGLISITVSMIILEVLKLQSSGMQDTMSTIGKMHEFILGILAISVFGPFNEELICRGFLLTRLRRIVSIRTAIIIQAIFFGAIHGNIVQFSYAFIIGIILGYICYYTDSIIPGTLMHIANNSMSCILGKYGESLGYLGYSIIILLICIGIYSLWSILKEFRNKEKVLQKEVA